MTSVLNVDTIADKAGTGPVALTKQSAAKAWVNFNGTGTIAARDSLNVSGLVDNGSGDYSVNFSNSFGNADYSMGGWCGYPGSRGAIFGDDVSHPTIYAAGTFRLRTSYVNGTNGDLAPFDVTYVNEIFHGDLA